MENDILYLTPKGVIALFLAAGCAGVAVGADIDGTSIASKATGDQVRTTVDAARSGASETCGGTSTNTTAEMYFFGAGSPPRGVTPQGLQNAGVSYKSFAFVAATPPSLSPFDLYPATLASAQVDCDEATDFEPPLSALSSVPEPGALAFVLAAFAVAWEKTRRSKT
jgi:hypothetical protein